MELKKAFAVCLISLFSATLVMLIARALDSQAAARLEPQLARIAEELKAIRSAGGLAVPSVTAFASGQSLSDGLVVYYFHSNTRCPTCEAIESQSHATIRTDFATQLESGDLIWKVLNYEEPSVSGLATKFEIQMPVVVLARMKAGQVENWKRLDQVWGLVGDKPAFADFIRTEVSQMLDAGEKEPASQPSDDVSAIPVPGSDMGEPPAPAEPPAIPTPQ